MKVLAKEILDTVEVGALATVNVDRAPLITPLHFARFGNSIIWISEPTARHSENAFRNGKAEFVVWDDKKRAVFLKTNVTELPESEKEAAMAEAEAAMPESEAAEDSANMAEMTDSASTDSGQQAASGNSIDGQKQSGLESALSVSGNESSQDSTEAAPEEDGILKKKERQLPKKMTVKGQ